jgi:hypothetical protein
MKQPRTMAIATTGFVINLVKPDSSTGFFAEIKIRSRSANISLQFA